MSKNRKLTLNKYGSRVVQTALSYVSKDQHTRWINEINKVGIIVYQCLSRKTAKKERETQEYPGFLGLLYFFSGVRIRFLPDSDRCSVPRTKGYFWNYIEWTSLSAFDLQDLEYDCISVIQA